MILGMMPSISIRWFQYSKGGPFDTLDLLLLWDPQTVFHRIMPIPTQVIPVKMTTKNMLFEMPKWRLLTRLGKAANFDTWALDQSLDRGSFVCFHSTEVTFYKIKNLPQKIWQFPTKSIASHEKVSRKHMLGFFFVAWVCLHFSQVSPRCPKWPAFDFVAWVPLLQNQNLMDHITTESRI